MSVESGHRTNSSKHPFERNFCQPSYIRTLRSKEITRIWNELRIAIKENYDSFGPSGRHACQWIACLDHEDLLNRTGESCCSGRTGVINSRGCYNVLSLPFDLVAVSRFPESRRIPAFEHWLIIRRIRTLSNLRAISPIGKRYTMLLALASLRSSRISYTSLITMLYILDTTHRIWFIFVREITEHAWRGKLEIWRICGSFRPSSFDFDS